ncbi:MAG: phage holin family protein [Clostridiaceae bacterium]|nr:phage holin family protein [Clostridiaceae bacterium]
MRFPVLICAAGVGGVLSSLWGGWDVLLKALLIMMAVDYITGLCVAALGRSNKSLTGHITSNAAFLGLIKKVAILLIVLVAAQLETVTGTSLFRSTVAMFFIGSEGLSIIENTGLLGVPLPSALKKWFEALRNKNDTGGGNDGT